jgi:hypothetical protein
LLHAQAHCSSYARLQVTRCCICTRIYCFAEAPSTIFGEEMKEQREGLEMYEICVENS